MMRKSRISRYWRIVRHPLRRVRRWSKRAFTAYVSSLGWMVAILALLSLIAFTMLGWHELFATASAYLLMLAAAILMSLGNTSFSASTHISGRCVTVGDTVRVGVSVGNVGMTPTVSACASLPVGRDCERFSIPPLAAGRTHRIDMEFTAVARSVLQVGPLSIRKGDPFGLIRREKRLDERTQVFIHPPIVPITMSDAGMQHDFEGCPSREIVNDDLDFQDLREYEPGDDLRNVHWLSSMKTGTLMVRQYESTRRNDTVLVLDVDPRNYANAREFELAVSVHASIGVECLLRNRPLTTHVGNVRAIPVDTMSFLDSCSAIEPDFDDAPNLAQGLLDHAGNASFLLFTVGRFKDIDEIKRMIPALPSFSTCVVLRIVGEQRSDIRGFPDFTVITVGKLDDLPAIMGALPWP